MSNLAITSLTIIWTFVAIAAVTGVAMYLITHFNKLARENAHLREQLEFAAVDRSGYESMLEAYEEVVQAQEKLLEATTDERDALRGELDALAEHNSILQEVADNREELLGLYRDIIECEQKNHERTQARLAEFTKDLPPIF